MQSTLRNLVCGGALCAVAAVAVAQSPIPRIAFLSASPISSITARTDAFREGLRDLGYIEGQNIVIEWISADDDFGRLPSLATGLVQRRVAVIVTAEGPATSAARKATSSIPIVMGQTADPVAAGFVASLARPGGNTTGLTTSSAELPIKQIELLKQTLPKLSKLAVLANPDNVGTAPALNNSKSAARDLGLPMRVYEVRDARAFDATFDAMSHDGIEGLIVLPDPMFLSRRSAIADEAIRHRIPAIYGIPEHVQAGGLMCYAADRTVLFRRAATYVDRILRGAKPSQLPVEQPTKFEFLINLQAAKLLALKIPQSVLLRADAVIE